MTRKTTAPDGAEPERSQRHRGTGRLRKSAYPAPLPLSHKAAVDLLDRLDEFASLQSGFLTFVQIPVEERVGEWRFAGASPSLAGAVGRIDEFAVAMRLNDPRRSDGFLRGLLEETGACDDEYMYPRRAPVRVGVPNTLVLAVRYGAPYEGLGACVVEVESIAGTPFEGLAPQTERPKEWCAFPALEVLPGAWRTETVAALAREMSESLDFSAMPILADALQDAGCNNEDILYHCRSPGPHVRECWVLNLLLGRK